ncbi:hypothetical protein EG329_007277 [Mollisiaceae sp. DMI_Dod_QoI]|nr:hypothetical protein EG329_007277 [Helotiales sp. DMI_Dod_QoI]
MPIATVINELMNTNGSLDLPKLNSVNVHDNPDDEAQPDSQDLPAAATVVQKEAEFTNSSLEIPKADGMTVPDKPDHKAPIDSQDAPIIEQNENSDGNLEKKPDDELKGAPHDKPKDNWAGWAEKVKKPVDEKKSEAKAKLEENKTGTVSIVRVDRRKSWTHNYVLSAKSKKKISRKYALVVRKEFDDNNQYLETLVEIRGDSLKDFLAGLFHGAEGLRLNETPPLMKHSLLFHAAPELRKRLEKEEASENKDGFLIFDIKAALQLVSEDFADVQQSLTSLISKGEITFNELWAIFPPNELVYTLDALSEPHLLRATDHEVREGFARGKFLWIGGRCIDDDGKSLGWAETRDLEIPMFSGAKAIADLPVFPLRFHPDGKMREKLIERGRRRLQLINYQLFEDSGHGLREKELPDGSKVFEKFLSHGRIIIDHKAYSQINHSNGFIPKIDQPLDKDTPKEDELITLPSMMYGFSLGDKVWGGFVVARIETIKWDDSIWDSLVLSQAQKKFVTTLVSNHVSQTNIFDDFVRDKGKGLIGLLAGPSGVGKTLTAEAVAETVRRPLYILSSGDLGSQPWEVDKKLKQVFELAETWQSVVLLDEADVFMSKRSNTDIVHNAMVSIFLRQLEYYQGILILTTNCVETIDTAFQSRIHFCHLYPELNHAARKLIWTEFLRRSAADPNLEVKVDAAGINELAQLELNGRQIKNTVKMAISISREEKIPLTKEEIQTVVTSLPSAYFTKKKKEETATSWSLQKFLGPFSSIMLW